MIESLDNLFPNAIEFFATGNNRARGLRRALYPSTPRDLIRVSALRPGKCSRSGSYFASITTSRRRGNFPSKSPPELLGRLIRSRTNGLQRRDGRQGDEARGMKENEKTESGWGIVSDARKSKWLTNREFPSRRQHFRVFRECECASDCENGETAEEILSSPSRSSLRRTAIGIATGDRKRKIIEENSRKETISLTTYREMINFQIGN